MLPAGDDDVAPVTGRSCSSNTWPTATHTHIDGGSGDSGCGSDASFGSFINRLRRGAAGDGWLHDTRPTATATRTAAAEAAAANANANATSSPILGAAATTKSVHSEKLKGIYI